MLIKQAEERENNARLKILNAQNLLNSQTENEIHQVIENDENDRMEIEFDEISQHETKYVENEAKKKNSALAQNTDVEMEHDFEIIDIRPETDTHETDEKVIIRKANDESRQKDYKPSIRIINQEKMTKEERNHIKLSDKHHHSKQTNLENLDQNEQKKLDAFRARNAHGHAGDSQIQNLIYNNQDNFFSSKSKQAVVQEAKKINTKETDTKLVVQTINHASKTSRSVISTSSNSSSTYSNLNFVFHSSIGKSN